MTQQNRETFLAVVRGAFNGLVGFVAWILVMAAIVAAVVFAKYWMWLIPPAAFIALGIRCEFDRLARIKDEPK